MTTSYGLNALRFESRWATRYPVPIQIDPPKAHPASYTVGNEFIYGGVKRPECGTDNSPPSSARVKHVFNYTCISPLCLHGVLRYSFATSRFEKEVHVSNFWKEISECTSDLCHTGWRTKCHTIDCTHNSFIVTKAFDIWYRINHHRLENCS